MPAAPQSQDCLCSWQGHWAHPCQGWLQKDREGWGTCLDTSAPALAVGSITWTRGGVGGAPEALGAFGEKVEASQGLGAGEEAEVGAVLQGDQQVPLDAGGAGGFRSMWTWAGADVCSQAGCCLRLSDAAAGQLGLF